jgi:hypothetical protein
MVKLAWCHSSHLAETMLPGNQVLLLPDHPPDPDIQRREMSPVLDFGFGEREKAFMRQAVASVEIAHVETGSYNLPVQPGIVRVKEHVAAMDIIKATRRLKD